MSVQTGNPLVRWLGSYILTNRRVGKSTDFVRDQQCLHPFTQESRDLVANDTVVAWLWVTVIVDWFLAEVAA